MAKQIKTKSDEKSVTNMELVAICDQLPENANQTYVSQTDIEHLILNIRGTQVIIDRDLAMLYQVETKRLNEQVKRNLERFPDRFRFQLSKEETNELVANCDRFKLLKHSSTTPFAFTEQGIAMLSTVLHSQTAVEVSIKIMDAFVAMRHFLYTNAQVFQRLSNIEYHQIETDKRIEEVFKRLDENIQPKQGIFFDGQVFDAYFLHQTWSGKPKSQSFSSTIMWTIRYWPCLTNGKAP